MAGAVSMEGPQDAFDWAGVVALLGMLGGGIAWLWDKLTGAITREARQEADRDERIEQREERYIAKVEKRISAMEDDLKAIKRDYGLVVGIAHVMVDELIVVGPISPSLKLVTAKIREAYPVITDTPSEMLHLLQRLDAANRKRDMP